MLNTAKQEEAFPINFSEKIQAVKWSWACRALTNRDTHWRIEDPTVTPQVGDVVMAKVEKIGNHTRLMMDKQQRLDLYPGDVIVGVMGNRYATDAFEGHVSDVANLNMLTGAGMFGTVRSRFTGTKRPTELSFLGYLTDPTGWRINLKEQFFKPRALAPAQTDIILVVGTGMNAGKTTMVSKLVWGLRQQGKTVAACKLTGSLSQRDLHSLEATGATDVRDFSDYGFPSTYLCSKEELHGLYATMIQDATSANPDVIVVEIADGILQRETNMVLEDTVIRSHIRGVILAAHCAPSGLHGADCIRNHSHDLLAVSGVMTSSPLSVQEFKSHSNIPVASSTDYGEGIAAHILRTLEPQVV